MHNRQYLKSEEIGYSYGISGCMCSEHQQDNKTPRKLSLALDLGARNVIVCYKEHSAAF